jgi:AcrR family transcriptional regulator
MPKIISEHEKDMIYEAIYQSTIKLISKKGLKGITVDNITNDVKMAKGSFYKYHKSKEECLYYVITRYEQELLEKMKPVIAEPLSKKGIFKKVLQEIYLADDSLFLYIKPEDIKVLLRKLPAEYADELQTKSKLNFEYILQLFGLDRTKISMGVLNNLISSIHFIASQDNETPERKVALELLVNTVVEYLITGINDKSIRRLKK